MNDKLIIPLTPNQLSRIKNFLLQWNIKCDNKKQFGLIAEPHIDDKSLYIKLLSVKKYNQLDDFFKQNEFYKVRYKPLGKKRGKYVQRQKFGINTK